MSEKATWQPPVLHTIDASKTLSSPVDNVTEDFITSDPDFNPDVSPTNLFKS